MNIASLDLHWNTCDGLLLFAFCVSHSPNPKKRQTGCSMYQRSFLSSKNETVFKLVETTTSSVNRFWAWWLLGRQFWPVDRCVGCFSTSPQCSSSYQTAQNIDERNYEANFEWKNFVFLQHDSFYQTRRKPWCWKCSPRLVTCATMSIKKTTEFSWFVVATSPGMTKRQCRTDFRRAKPKKEPK